MQPLDYFKQRSGEDWLIDHSSQEFSTLVQQTLQELDDYSHQCASPRTAPTILLAERHPLKFLARFTAACITNSSICLANPAWAEAEWQQVFELIQPDILWGEEMKSTPPTPYSLLPTSPTPLILIPTGGTSGTIRFAMHTWETLMASVQGFQQFFGLQQVNSCCVLPLYHVSGLMQFLRSFTSGGNLVVSPFKTFEQGHFPDIEPENFFLSLVPTQLQRLMNSPSYLSWLARFQTVLLGGAPAWMSLLETARQHQIRLAPTYGMTETASQIATLKPDDFLAGNMSCGQVLPHAQIRIYDSSGEVLNPHQQGTLKIQAKSMALGYYPSRFDSSNSFQPDDLGFFDQQGYLHIVGRSSDKIITGGENVFPTEVEAAIRSTGLVKDVYVTGLPDQQWGQVVTAAYIPANEDVEIPTLQASLSSILTKYKRPKRWIAINQLPQNAQGKVNRRKVEELLTVLQSSTDAANQPLVPQLPAESGLLDQCKHDES